jgi:hypothetical protein
LQNVKALRKQDLAFSQWGNESSTVQPPYKCAPIEPKFGVLQQDCAIKVMDTSSGSLEINHICTSFDAIEIVSLFLHHYRSFRQIGWQVICGTNTIYVRVRQLQFNVDMLIPLLAQDRRRQPSESISSHTPPITHTIQGKEYGVIAHAF